MKRLILVLLLLPALAGTQTFPPGGGAGGVASAPSSQVDGCVTPGYNFATLTAMGMCHDDGTGPYGFNAVAVQTSDPTDLEYAGIVASEAGPFFFQVVALDEGGANGTTFYGQGVDSGIALWNLTSANVGGSLGSFTYSTDDDESIWSVTDGTGTVDVSNSASGNLNLSVDDGTDSCSSDMTPFGYLACEKLFANLGTPGDGTVLYCSDCTKATPCAAAGNGAIAKRLNGAWDCD